LKQKRAASSRPFQNHRKAPTGKTGRAAARVQLASGRAVPQFDGGLAIATNEQSDKTSVL